jgi:hypothetical protein
MIADSEMMDIRSVMQEMQSDTSKVSYFNMILNDTINLVTYFVDISNNELLEFSMPIEVITKFESLKSDLNKKIA